MQATISGGIANLEYKVRSYFTGGAASDRTIEVYVGTTLVDQYTLEAMGTIYTRNIADINVSGEVLLNFVSTGSRQLVLDDISWTGYTGGGNVPPSITNITQTPSEDIINTTTVSVSATITDSDGTVSSAQLRWGTTSGTYGNTISMSASGDTYTTVSDIPAQSTGTTVYYVIDATDDDSDTTTSSEQSYTVVAPATTTIPYTQDFSSGWGETYLYDVSGRKNTG